MKLKFSLLLIGFLLVFSKNSFGQLDSIFLKDGRILTEPYSVSFDKRNLVNKKNPDLKIPASSVKKFKTKKNTYFSVDVTFHQLNIDKLSFFAKEIFKSDIDLLELKIPKGTVQYYEGKIELYFFKKGEVIQLLGKNTLNENYFNFFGDCYLKIAEREFKYSKNEIIRKLTEYNHCINPEFQAQSVSPFLKRTELILFGEFGFARHNSGHSLYENSKINSTSFGGGVNLEFLIRKNWVLGFGCSQSKNFVVSNDFILTSFNVPEKLDFEFNDWDVNFFMGYRKKFNSKLSIIPKFGVLVGGFQKIRIIAIRL